MAELSIENSTYKGLVSGFEKHKFGQKESKIISNLADSFYKACRDDHIYDLPNPVCWLEKQKDMRLKWENYCNSIEPSDDQVLKKYLLNQIPFAAYMRFMYERFPVNFLQN